MALAVQLRLIRAAIDSDLPGARSALDSAISELREALEELRELARGIHPAVLTNYGLERAVAALAARSPVPVEIAAMPEERLPPPVEAAAYYIIAEAITNVAKYAAASHITVTVDQTTDCTRVEVTDDGVGGADPAAGSGLRGIADRVEALNGRLAGHEPGRGGHHGARRAPADGVMRPRSRSDDLRQRPAAVSRLASVAAAASSIRPALTRSIRRSSGRNAVPGMTSVSWLRTRSRTTSASPGR